MKKFLAIILTICILLMVGCNNKNSSGNNDSSSPEVTTTAEKIEKNVNLLKNGDFKKTSMTDWGSYFNGGKASVSNTDSQMEVAVEDAGTLDYAVQVFQDGFKLYQGGKYTLTFDAKSTVNRKFTARIQINGGDYHAYVEKVFDLTDKLQTYTLELDMTEASDPAPRLCFNLGLPKDSAPLGKHSVFISNASLMLTDDSAMAKASTSDGSININVNQLGYRPDYQKIAVFSGSTADKNFNVVNVDTNKIVYTGEIKDKKENSTAGQTNYYGDFSSVKDAGNYKITTASMGESYQFKISNDVYDNAFNSVLKMLYLQRCGTELTKATAGDFAHPACHNTPATIFGTNNKIDVSGGWHDAGDYGRYVVAGAKTVADLLLAYQSNPSKFGDSSGIPESSNKVPDILDEARYELDWMLKMQDAGTGGVHHKVTCANFPGMIMPEKETEPLIVSLVSDAATADFASVMAMSYDTYSGIDKAFADKCLAASKKAWDYLNSKDKLTGFSNSTGIVTGEYGDGNINDEFMWASTQLYKSTGDQKYHDKLKSLYFSTSYDLGWANVGIYAMNSYLNLPSEKRDSALYEKMKTNLISLADGFVETSKNDGYMISLRSSYPWGSNMTVANNGMLLQLANKISPKAEYVSYARSHFNYLFGTNPMSISYVTGFGTVSPVSTHHRPSQALKKTMPGMLVGGPDSSLEDPYAKAVLSGKPPAKCYADNAQSYSCNEITIYWNSPLIFLMTNL